MRISLSKINEYAESKQLNALAFATKVKARNKRSLIINYKDKDAHNQFNISRPTYLRYLNVLRQHGDLIEDDKNARIRRLHSQMDELNPQDGCWKKMVYLEYFTCLNGDIRYIANYILAKAFYFHLCSQKYMVDTKLSTGNMSDPDSLKELKQAKRDKRKLNHLGYIGNDNETIHGLNKDLQNAIETIKNLFSISTYRVYKLISFLVKKGKIKVDKCIQYIGRYKKGMEQSLRSRYYFISKANNLYSVSSNIYTII